MPHKKTKKLPSWSLYPKLHQEVLQQLQDEHLDFEFFEDDTLNGCIKDYDTNIMGRFICRNVRCSNNGWSSKKIAITIRMYQGDRYNARVYHQRCKKCSSLSQPILDSSYAERVAYRLKKWSGIQMEAPEYGGQSSGPHQRALCEGCRHGHCTNGS